MAKTLIRLNSARAVQRFLARLINETYNGQVDCDVARVLGSLCKIQLDSFKTVEFEERILDLEKIVSTRNYTHG